MRIRPTGPSLAKLDPLLGKWTWITLAVAGALTALWLWSCWCSFPSNPWNDIRVAPAVALHRGISIYTTESSGPVSSWIYGPLPLLLLWPAGLASTAAGSIGIAGALHIGLLAGGFFAVCLLWPPAPGAPAESGNLRRRLATALICVLLMQNESGGYRVYTADAPGMVLGALSLLALVQRRSWLAALAAAAAVTCKQTLLGVGLAEVIWLGVTFSGREAARHAGRCLITGMAFVAVTIAVFGAAGLWHTMFVLPAGFPWVPADQRLQQHLVALVIQVGLPPVVMAIGWRFFFDRKSPLLLPVMAFFCVLPFSLAGLVKAGGNLNSLHGFWLWLPPTLVAATGGKAFARFGGSGRLLLALLAAVLASISLQSARLRVQPNVQAYREAADLARQLPERVWFPMHPLVTLYSDGRFYHDFDGLLERVIAGHRLTNEHYFACMPPHRHVVATLLPVGWGPADTAEARLPAGTAVDTFGSWRLDVLPK